MNAQTDGGRARVLYLNDVGGRPGGGERRLIRLTASVNDRGIEPIVACIPGGSVEETLNNGGIETIALAQLRKNPVAAAGRVARICRERTIDIVHTGSYLTDFAGRIGGSRAGVPVVTTVNCEPDSYKIAGGGWGRRLVFPIRSAVDKLMSGKTDLFIAVSNPVAAKLAAGGVPRTKIQVVPNGIDVGDVRRLAGNTQRSTSEKEFHVGTVARLDPVKGLDIFIKAIHALVERGLAVKATIVGSGEQRGALEELAGALGLKKAIDFTGHVDNP